MLRFVPVPPFQDEVPGTGNVGSFPVTKAQAMQVVDLILIEIRL
jgi:hypothetical protein